ncbi:TPA: hypothetical protein N0F65_012684 [Lagenidium giganteum]|uniref:GPI ethanolamine phosphate transferase 3 n=1 Tax=Lagenidium giganteum TaxID=4803 RepID=A0AAV2YMM9_9STRA|nr:TPA: hypothetical protein N0F65_012684 [Lagenidium giganteum]
MRRAGWTSLLWLTCVHTVAFYLFTTGFFLTRFEVKNVSVCTELPHEQAIAPGGAAGGALRREEDREAAAAALAAATATADTTGCWLEPRFRRVIFVVVDALRFDFVAAPAEADTPPDSDAAFYRHHLRVLTETLAAQPTRSLLFKFVADPPTMTMQRLKGLTTGSLPTFLDIKDNMASSSAIAEDNLIQQMHLLQRPMVFMGDDTWDALYAPYFTRKYSYDSFNVKDLDTVDNGVLRHLFPELQQDDWRLLIAHFLGVDHVGHTHGPSSPFMTKKLEQMNTELGRLMKELPDDTLLLIMGDHGMSADGNHGGATDEETGAALFLYSKKPLVAEEHASHTNEWPKEVPQVDLVPTLSLLTGLPIPFGSLGMVIPQLFFGSPVNKSDEHVRSSYRHLNKALRLNVDQVRRYLLTYSTASKLPEHEYQHLETIYNQVQDLDAKLYEEERVGSGTTATKLQEALAQLQQRYLREALALGRSMWTQFDLGKMMWGVAFLVWAVVIAGCAVVSFNNLELGFPVRGVTIGAGLATAVVLSGFQPISLPSDIWSKMAVITTTIGLLDATAQVVFNRASTPSRTSSLWSVPSLPSMAAFLVVLLHVLALTSNSFIVAEDAVMHFFSMTAGLCLFVHTYRSARPKTKEVGLVMSVVFMVVTRIARGISPPNIIQSTPSMLRTLLTTVALVALAFALVTFREKWSTMTSWLRKVGFLACVLSGISCLVYWYFSPLESKLLRLWLPRSVLLAPLIFVVVLIQVYSSDRQSLRSARPGMVVFRLDYFVLLLLLVPAYMLVLGPTSPVSVLLLILQSWSFSFVVFCCTDHAVPTSFVLLWTSVVYQSFFLSGHQNTFTSLQNAAGFVGFDDFDFLFAGALLAFNTYGNYLVLLAALPLLLFNFVSKKSWQGLRSQWWQAVLAIVAYFALNATVSTVFVGIQRRHLMVWAIFAPKYIFDGITLLVIEALLLLLSPLVLRHFQVKTNE